MNWYSKSWKEAPGLMFAAHFLFPAGIDAMLLLVLAPMIGLFAMVGWLLLTLALFQLGNLFDMSRW